MILGKSLKLFENLLGLNPISETCKQDILNFQNIENQEFWSKVIDSCSSKNVIVISDNLQGPIGLRFRCQLNENSKLTAQNYVLPEFNHNGIVGLESLNKNEYVVLVVYNEGFEHVRTKIHRQFVINYLEDNQIEVLKVSSDYLDFLTHLLSVTQNLDLVSFLIAKTTGVDPIAVDSISQLKSKLQEN
jgi:glucose/mannose-6-phosphate isomerase